MKYAIIIFASIVMAIVCVHVNGGVKNQIETTPEPVERMVFREIPAEINIKEEKKEFVKTKVFAATDGTFMFILFDRKGYSGRNIVSADCRLVLGNEVKSKFQISHCVQNSCTMFMVREEAVSASVRENMKKVTLENVDVLSIRLERVILQ